MKQKKSTIIIGDLNIIFSAIDRTRRKKISNEDILKKQY